MMGPILKVKGPRPARENPNPNVAYSSLTSAFHRLTTASNNRRNTVNAISYRWKNLQS